MLWSRFIDDCGGLFDGAADDFMRFFKILSDGYEAYGLKLTHEWSLSEFKMLDIHLYVDKNGELQTKEFRKETGAKISFIHKCSSKTYLQRNRQMSILSTETPVL